jgi:hypothetical protein
LRIAKSKAGVSQDRRLLLFPGILAGRVASNTVVTSATCAARCASLGLANVKQVVPAIAKGVAGERRIAE